jgi:hypothetical protein
MFDTDRPRSEARSLLALAAVAALLAITAYGRWDARSWNTPVEYGNLGYDADTMAVLAQIKAASQGNFPPLLTKTVPQLGAPFTANWNDAPMIEQLLFWLTGCLASASSLFFAANAMVLFSHVLAALCFYTVCRVLHCDLRWSFAGAIIFAFARFPFTRQLHHPQVLYEWHVPACLLVGWWLLDGHGFKLRDQRFWIAIAIAVITGVQHPYYTNMFVQLTGLACLVQWARGNRPAVAFKAEPHQHRFAAYPRRHLQLHRFSRRHQLGAARPPEWWHFLGPPGRGERGGQPRRPPASGCEQRRHCSWRRFH